MAGLPSERLVGEPIQGQVHRNPVRRAGWGKSRSSVGTT